MNEEFEFGDIVEVRDWIDGDWHKGKFLALDESSCPYVVRKDDAVCASGYKFCRKARPDLKINDPVWVRYSKNGDWLPRHFAGWYDDGRIQVFLDGTTSHSNTAHKFGIVAWTFYSLEKPDEDSN